jgi:hypothetical protein
MRRVSSEFGFTPAGRGRISAPLDELPLLELAEDEFEEEAVEGGRGGGQTLASNLCRPVPLIHTQKLGIK